MPKNEMDEEDEEGLVQTNNKIDPLNICDSFCHALKSNPEYVNKKCPDHCLKERGWKKKPKHFNKNGAKARNRFHFH